MTTSSDANIGADSARDPLGLSGTVLADKYHIGAAIGEGGFSVVYRAEHTIWQQPVAIKFFKILANAAEHQRQELLDGFIQEGKLMAQLSSRNAAIVQARDIGNLTTPSGQWIPYMVLEWLDGKPLNVVLGEEQRAGLPPRSLEEAMVLLEPAATALDVAHQRNIAHRDVKPANLFVLGDPRGDDVRLKVLDFGIAKVMADHASSVTALAQTGKDITSFTPSYGAPEQFSRTYGATGPWTDVYAMALILVEVLRGGLPALDGEDFMQLAVASRDTSRRPTPRSHGVPVSNAVEGVFLTALAVSPRERFATMGQFWTALMRATYPESPTWRASAPGGPRSSASDRPIAEVLAAGATEAAPLRSQHTPPGVLGTGQNSIPAIDHSARTVAAPGQPTSPKRSHALTAVVIVAALAGAIGVYRLSERSGASDPSRTAVSNSPPAPARSDLASLAVNVGSAAIPARRTQCPEGMVLVPGGRFFMGSDDPAFKLWQPAHKVTLDTFCININEVTTAEYKACSEIGECKRPPTVPDYPKSPGQTDAEHQKETDVYAELCNFGKEGRENHPINCVPWGLADAYCKVKAKRLPTEAEWEFAARGSDGRAYPWGDEPGDATRMNACGTECTRWELAHGLKPTLRMYMGDDGFPGTAPVGSFPKGKTKYGANDFVGNVWEWTADLFETYKADEVVNPRGAPAGERRAMRGGGFNGGVALWLNPAFRYHQLETASSPALGFRCAATL